MAFATFTAAGQVATTKAALLTSTGVETIILHFTLHNTSATPQTFVVYHKLASGTSKVIDRGALAQDETRLVVSDGEKITLAAGDSIEAQTTTASVLDWTMGGGQQ